MGVDLNNEYFLVVEQGDTPMQIFCKGYQLGLRHATRDESPQTEAAELDQLNAEMMSRATRAELDTPIEELGLPKLLNGHLKKRGVKIVRDLAYTPGVVIRGIDGVGEQGVYEVQEKVREFMYERIEQSTARFTSVK